MKRQKPCPQCRANGRDKTGNHLFLVKDNSRWLCTRCNYTEPNEDAMTEAQTSPKAGGIEALAGYPIRAISERKLTKETCQHYGVLSTVSEETGEITGHAYPFTIAGKVTGFKVRKLPKSFSVVGDSAKCQLFGQASTPQGGKKLLITGGELDALSAFQMLKEKYPNYTPAVVSLPKGENTASIKDNLEYIQSFEEVYIYTDMDEPGRKAADDICKLIGHKCKIVSTSEKDASDMLTKGKQGEFINAYFSASVRKPEGILAGNQVTLEALKKPTAIGYDLPYPALNKMMAGLRKGELTTLTAGSGVGKSTLAREIGYHLRKYHDLTIGNIFLEETIEKTINGYISIDNNVPLSTIRKNPGILTDKQWQESYDNLIGSKWFGLKHFGSMPTEDLLDKIRYLAYGEGCDFIILDHLSLVFSGQDSSNERKDIDMAMTQLAAFVNESGIGLIVVVHLSRNKGKASFNEGGQISLNDLRGSAALEQLSWNVIGLERSQQDEDTKNLSKIRMLKNRENGWTGIADTCEYNFETGRLVPIEEPAGSF